MEIIEVTRMHMRHLLPLLKKATSDWVDDGAMRRSSSLAYYAIFSLAPPNTNPAIEITITSSAALDCTAD